MSVRAKSILGIYREREYSLNAVKEDRTILEHTLSRLQQDAPGVLKIRLVEADDVASCGHDFDFVLTMAQGEQVLEHLRTLEDAGIEIWNSPRAVRACYRETLSRILTAADVRYPPYLLVETCSPLRALPAWFDGGVWVKRGDVHATTVADVAMARDLDAVNATLSSFYERGIVQAVLHRHVDGQLVKFSAVAGGFFKCRVMTPIQDALIMAAPDTIQRQVAQGAQALGLQVFGGDCVIDQAGSIHVIDINDWPSFRTCVSDASALIARRVVSAVFGPIASSSHKARRPANKMVKI